MIRAKYEGVVTVDDAEMAGNMKLDVEDLISRAAENRAGIDTKTDFAIKLMRQAIKGCAEEYDETIKLERAQVKRLGGLYVIGTRARADALTTN